MIFQIIFYISYINFIKLCETSQIFKILIPKSYKNKFLEILNSQNFKLKAFSFKSTFEVFVWHPHIDTACLFSASTSFNARIRSNMQYQCNVIMREFQLVSRLTVETWHLGCHPVPPWPRMEHPKAPSYNQACLRKITIN